MTVKDLFYREREAWLTQARLIAIKLLKKKRTITVEDVLKRHERPDYVHRNTVGQIFRTKDFRPCGWSPSKRPAMNGRQVRVWRLKGSLWEK